MNPLEFIPEMPDAPQGEVDDGVETMLSELTLSEFSQGMFNLVNYILDNRDDTKKSDNYYLRGGGGGTSSIDAILME